MGNRTLITYFISILSASLLFFGIASAGSFAADQFAFGKRFGDHTYVGPFNLSKQTHQDAEIKLSSDLLSMQDNLHTDLVYQDTTFPLPVELVEYNPAATIEQAESEAENSLVASVSEDGLRTLLQQELPMLSMSDSELSSISSGISEKLESGIMPQSVILTDYLESLQPTMEIASASISVDGLTSSVMELVDSLDGTVIESDESFSLLQYIETTQPGLLDGNELTLLASALYDATLHTNFWVEDRTIRRQLTDGVEPGFESAINPQLGLDFVMTNPNSTSYILTTSWESGVLSVGIQGLPLRYTYEPYVLETQSYGPKSVIQYSETLSVGQVRVTEPGVDGFEVIVQRRIIEDGQVIATEDVSEDFYPPVPRVEERPFIEQDVPTTENGSDSGLDSNSDSDSSIGENGDGNRTNSGSDNSADDSSEKDSNKDSGSQSGKGSNSNSNSNGNSSDNNSSKGNGSSSKDPDDSVDSIDGKPSTKPDSDGHIYDKGGNLIK